jgi:hypothetical protein
MMRYYVNIEGISRDIPSLKNTVHTFVCLMVLNATFNNLSVIS